MSDNNMTTCPMCFTRMRNINKTLTCPECGYKYCDHNRERGDMFNDTHTHASDYTTSHGTQPQKNVARVVKIIVIIYLILMLCPMVCSVLGTIITFLGANILSQKDAEYQGQEINVTVAPGEEAAIDIDSLLASIEATTPASIEYEDDEFVTELIKHIFEVSDCADVTTEELCSVYWLEIYRDSSDCLYAQYNTRNGSSGVFVSDITQIRVANLNAFADLEILYSPDITYESGDLMDLKSLKHFSCKSTPIKLIGVISSPEQLSELHLTIPSDSSTLEGLQYFSELQILEISAQNASVDDVGRIGDLDKLIDLTYIDAGELQDFSFLSELPTLKYLFLNAPSLSNLDFLYDLPNLQLLTFLSSDVTNLQPITAVADTLVALDMSSSTFIKDYAPLTEMTNLEYLAMDYCGLTDLSFASKLENLTSLSIRNNQITSLEPLKDLPCLTSLQTYNTSIEDYAGLESICE